MPGNTFWREVTMGRTTLGSLLPLPLDQHNKPDRDILGTAHYYIGATDNHKRWVLPHRSYFSYCIVKTISGVWGVLGTCENVCETSASLLNAFGDCAFDCGDPHCRKYHGPVGAVYDRLPLPRLVRGHPARPIAPPGDVNLCEGMQAAILAGLGPRHPNRGPQWQELLEFTNMQRARIDQISEKFKDDLRARMTRLQRRQDEERKARTAVKEQQEQLQALLRSSSNVGIAYASRSGVATRDQGTQWPPPEESYRPIALGRFTHEYKENPERCPARWNTIKVEGKYVPRPKEKFHLLASLIHRFVPYYAIANLDKHYDNVERDISAHTFSFSSGEIIQNRDAILYDKFMSSTGSRFVHPFHHATPAEQRAMYRELEAPSRQ